MRQFVNVNRFSSAPTVSILVSSSRCRRIPSRRRSGRLKCCRLLLRRGRLAGSATSSRQAVPSKPERREPRQRGGPIHDLVQLRGRGGAPYVDRKPEHGGDTWMPSG